MNWKGFGRKQPWTKILSWHLPAATEEKYDKPQSG
jgi:hypothetical protein